MSDCKERYRSRHGEYNRAHRPGCNPVRDLLLSYKSWRLLSRLSPGSADHYRRDRRYHDHRFPRIQMEERS